MLPILLDLKFIKIPTFGVFLVLAFFWGMFFLWKNIKLTSQKEEEIFDGLFIALGGGLFFSRFIYVILNFSDFGFNLLKFILINGYPGLSLFGGLFGGFFTFWLFCLFKKINWLEVIDYFIPPLFLALFFGKLGSFFAGVDVGIKTNFFISTSYLGFAGSRHLVALYEGVFFGIASYLSSKILMALRRGVFPSGFVFYFFIFYFSVISLLLDNLKENHLYFLGRSFNFLISLILTFVYSIYFIYYFLNQPSFKKQIKTFFYNLLVFFVVYGKKAYQKIFRAIKKKTGEGGERVDKKNN